VKTVQTEIGSNGGTTEKTFRVRKTQVIEALMWLKTHNPLYFDIIIDYDNLDWIDGEEGDLERTLRTTEEPIFTRVDQTPENADLGPAPGQAFGPEEGTDNIQYYGYIEQGGSSEVSPEDKHITACLQDALESSPSKKEIGIDFPQIGVEPVNEYGDKRIFALAFPWLFPGGIGDVKDFPGHMSTWGRNLLLFRDGRFAKDKIFSFFAMNYISRHRNASSGRWFVSDFNKNCPETLEELQKEIAIGNTSFVSQIKQLL
jgi:hypothetical protein